MNLTLIHKVTNVSHSVTNWSKSEASVGKYSDMQTGLQNVLKSLKKSQICPIWGQSDPLWSQTYHPWLHAS